MADNVFRAGFQQQNFRVDLGGVIALLSKSLYSGPGVYIRELIQHAMEDIVLLAIGVDATAAGR
jgi:HSP90 family molecular chaperone